MTRIGIASPCPATTGNPASGRWRRRRSITSSTDRAISPPRDRSRLAFPAPFSWTPGSRPSSICTILPFETVCFREGTAMPQLVPPHGSETVKPLLLPETERAEERKRAETTQENPPRLPRGLRRVHAGDGSLYAARWVHGTRRLARFVPGHEADRGTFWPIPITLPVNKDLADNIHAERGGRARRWRSRRNSRRHGRSRQIRDRQEDRGRACLPHNRSEASRRSEGAGSGRCQSGRARSWS